LGPVTSGVILLRPVPARAQIERLPATLLALARRARKANLRMLAPAVALAPLGTGQASNGRLRRTATVLACSNLIDTLQREQAAMGIFVTPEPASRPMFTEATVAGVYRSPGWQCDYPVVQILTVADLLNGAEVKMPPTSVAFKQAQREDSNGGAVQGKLEL
jgi:hypothetical protein